MTVTLWCFGRSGSACKAALTMTFAASVWQPRFVDFFGGETRSSAFRVLDVTGEVPVLLDGARPLGQSGAIPLHVAGATGWLGEATPAERAAVLAPGLWESHPLSSEAGETRIVPDFLAPEMRTPGVLPFLEGRRGAAFSVLGARLKGRDRIAGDASTRAEGARAGYLDRPEPFGCACGDWPVIDRWPVVLAGLPGWKQSDDLMPGGPADRAPPERRNP
jgi:glutathione S-transferase